MTELKTLKDITNICITAENGFVSDLDAVYNDDLRKEAIKHLKELMEAEAEAKMDSDKLQIMGFGSVIIWIKDFFNITEEDLK